VSFHMVLKLVSRSKGKTQIKDVWEQGGVVDTWT